MEASRTLDGGGSLQRVKCKLKIRRVFVLWVQLRLLELYLALAPDRNLCDAGYPASGSTTNPRPKGCLSSPASGLLGSSLPALDPARMTC